MGRGPSLICSYFIELQVDVILAAWFCSPRVTRIDRHLTVCCHCFGEVQPHHSDDFLLSIPSLTATS